MQQSRPGREQDTGQGLILSVSLPGQEDLLVIYPGFNHALSG